MELNQITLKKSYEYLSHDKVLKFLINRFSSEIDIDERYNKNFPEALSDLIIEQQVSFKAAITIKKRFKEIIKDLDNSQIINLNISELKSIGISDRKASYIINVYEYFSKSSFDFFNSNNDQVISELCKIKGIGPWSSQMFLIFVLYRIDIFSKGDLALMNSIKFNYGITLDNEDQLDILIEKWSPYKTVASLLLWKSIEHKYFYS